MSSHIRAQLLDRFRVRSWSALIHSIRARTDLNKAEFAHRVGLSVSTISHWESGIRKPGSSSVKVVDQFCRKNFPHLYEGSGSLFQGESEEDVPPQKRIEGRLSETVAKASITDFKYDDQKKVMRIVPFDDDAAKITAREQEIELKNLIDTLDFGSRDILEELEGSNVDRRLAKLFRDYQSVLSIAPLNPRLLYRLGDIVATLIRGAEVREEFSDLSLIKIEGFVEDHKNLMRVYYAQAIARAHEVDRLNVRAGSTLDQVAVALEAAAKTILNIHTYGNLPRAEDSIPALLEDLRQDIVNYARSERKIAGDGGSGAEPSLGWKAAKTGAVSVLRFLLRAGERALHSSAALETVWPGSVRKIYESLKEIFPGMPDLPR